VALNNEIIVEQRALDAEIRRILRELTAKIAVHREELTEFHAEILEKDMLRARARYSVDTKGVFALDSGIFALRQARHPLLGSGAVPIDLVLAEGKRGLVITGPNTGGKTVTLKTAGLLAAMNQAGLAIPAAEGSSLPIFEAIFADIGDEQSIEESMSTFQAHITNIAAIERRADADSLVLLDELGTGTDPLEGASVAMAVLAAFVRRGCLTFVTTHHGALKNFAWAEPALENASVAFDPHNLKPTYQVLMGIPGESRAFDIALRTGLDAGIVDAARRYAAEGSADVSALIRGLEEKHKDMLNREALFARNERGLSEQKRKLDLRELKLRQKERELRGENLSRLARTAAEARKTLENLVRELREKGAELPSEDTRAVKDFLGGLQTTVDEETARETEREERENAEAIAEIENSPDKIGQSWEVPDHFNGIFTPGMLVLAGAGKLPGVIQKRAKKDKWFVTVGSVTVPFAEKDLQPVKSKAPIVTITAE
jgi:DNA mismatch repair protein MutS2